MWFPSENIEEGNKSTISYLSNCFGVSEKLIIEYCNKFGFVNAEDKIYKVFNDNERYYKYLDLCDYINREISNKDQEKINTILSFYKLPEIKTEQFFLSEDSPVIGNISDYKESILTIYNKIKRKQNLSTDDYDDLDVIFSSEYFYMRMPAEIKKTIIDNLDEGYKKHYFEKNIWKFLEKYKEIDSYKLRLNGVPLAWRLSEEKIKEFFLGNYKEISDILEIIEQKKLIILINCIPYMHSFLLPENIKKRVQELDEIERSNHILDNVTNQSDKIKVELFEKNAESRVIQDSDNYHLSKDFVDSIIEKIPAEYSDLEKTLYVYYMLCNTLTYDNYYYNDKENRKEHNMVRNNMVSISEKNNEVVCYQFASALKDILSTLGIRTSNLNYSSNPEKFADKHQKLEIFVDGLVIDADSTRRGLEVNDLAFFKIGKIGDGIRCEMFSKNLQEKFLKAKNKVSKDIMRDLNIVYYQELEDDIRAFENVCGYNVEDKSKKISFIFYEMSKINLSRVDSRGLLYQLYNRIFNDEEKKIIKYRFNTTNEEWSVSIEIGDNSFYYNFDTKVIDYNKLSQKNI